MLPLQAARGERNLAQYLQSFLRERANARLPGDYLNNCARIEIPFALPHCRCGQPRFRAKRSSVALLRLDYGNGPMVVTVIGAGPMQMPIHDIIYMICVGNRVMPASGAVTVRIFVVSALMVRGASTLICR